METEEQKQKILALGRRAAEKFDAFLKEINDGSKEIGLDEKKRAELLVWMVIEAPVQFCKNKCQMPETAFTKTVHAMYMASGE